MWRIKFFHSKPQRFCFKNKNSFFLPVEWNFSNQEIHFFNQNINFLRSVEIRSFLSQFSFYTIWNLLSKNLCLNPNNEFRIWENSIFNPKLHVINLRKIFLKSWNLLIGNSPWTKFIAQEYVLYYLSVWKNLLSLKIRNFWANQKHKNIPKTCGYSIPQHSKVVSIYYRMYLPSKMFNKVCSNCK